MEVFGEQLSSAAGCGRDTPPGAAVTRRRYPARRDRGPQTNAAGPGQVMIAPPMSFLIDPRIYHSRRSTTVDW